MTIKGVGKNFSRGKQREKQDRKVAGGFRKPKLTFEKLCIRPLRQNVKQGNCEYQLLKCMVRHKKENQF